MDIQTSPQNTSVKILIADDDEPTRILLRTVIHQWGYTVVEAADGEEAWLIMQQPNPPILLVLDWLMPKLYGIELCARIREKLAIQPYIILLTNVSGTSNIIKGLETGADEFITKPFNIMELKTRLFIGVKRIVERRSLIEKYDTLKQRLQELETSLVLMQQELDQLQSEPHKEGLDPALKEITRLINDIKKELEVS